ncbi:MAG: hypothetical protein QME88_12765, partial [Actinomycetota bacterium]|nr:hypothetical protein [Actinomycetota bacterium]
PGSSLIERLLGSPHMSGANLANTLDAVGLNFLTGLIANLDGTMIANAINDNPGAVNLLADLVAYMNPYFVQALVNNSDTNGALKNLYMNVTIYRASNPLLQLMPPDLQIRGAAVYIPPNKPSGPPP